MEMQQIIEQAEKNIRLAIKDYGAHTSTTEVLDDVSDDFIRRLAKDSSHAKQGLRELFSQSPVWDENIDALVINGTRTHDVDYLRISLLAKTILREPLTKNYESVMKAISFFSNPNLNDNERKDCIEAINTLAPKAYTSTKKQSRVFKALCVALGVADETAGSDFQKLFAQFADELTSKKINFKLYVSINPAHFLTMSNPKGDRRGQTLTSCHSFNSTEYDFNNGCSGYARDKTSFIVFTVANPRDLETLNNRKTTRQIFAYRPCSGILMQSRMYNTSGGTYGAQADSKLYRDLVQREISMLENVPNLWKTFHTCGEKEEWIDIGTGFGGYADWNYENFDGHISFRKDCNMNDNKPLKVGTYGLCICCGTEISKGLYCNSCKGKYICEECKSRVDELTAAYAEDGIEVWVCDECLTEHYIHCDECGKYHHENNINLVDDRYICNHCLHEYYGQCEECGGWHRQETMYYVHMKNGNEGCVCENCYDAYYYCCDKCGESYTIKDIYRVYMSNGDTVTVCEDCSELVEVCENETCGFCGSVIENKEKEEIE